MDVLLTTPRSARSVAAALAVLVLCVAHAPAAARAPQDPPPAPVPAPAPADPSWDKAADLKKKSAYLDAAKLFEAYAKENPGAPRATEALVEAGVCWFSTGRARQKLNRNTAESTDAFRSALGFFEQVTGREPATPFGGRAQYMRGSTRLFMGDLALAEREYGLVLEKFKSDAKYVPKALERRAAVRRHMLSNAGAIADLTRYQNEYPKGEDIESVKRYLQYCRMFEKPAPPLLAEAWAQGDPVRLEACRGDLVVVLFFATWCEHCEESRPYLLDLIERYTPMGVRFVGVMDHSKGQTLETIRAWLPTKKFTLPVMVDAGRTTASYLGSKLPDVAIIDRAGRLRWHDNPNNLQDVTIEALLMEDPSAPLGSGGQASPPAPK